MYITRVSGRRARICSATSLPSMRGMITSVMSRSIDASWLRASSIASCPSTAAEDLAAAALEDPSGHLSNAVLVLHQQDDLAASAPVVGDGRRLRHRRLLGRWEHDAARGADPRLRLALSVAARLGDDAIHGG
jgi:hypothetical protein